MPLTELRLRALRAKPMPGEYGDRDDLFLRVKPSGSMLWQWRLRTPDGETTVSFGAYPEVGLARARELHRAAREQVREGIRVRTQVRTIDGACP